MLSSKGWAACDRVGWCLGFGNMRFHGGSVGCMFLDMQEREKGLIPSPPHIYFVCD
jgi:hypothetical protein